MECLSPRVENKQCADIIDKVPSPIKTHKPVIESHQINELTESIVDDLIKNAFKPEPVNIEGPEDCDAAEAEAEEQIQKEKTLEQEYLEFGEEEDNLNINSSFQDQELSKEEVEHIKSPVKIRPGDDKFSDDEGEGA